MNRHEQENPSVRRDYVVQRLNHLDQLILEAQMQDNWPQVENLKKERLELTTEFTMLEPDISEEARMSQLEEEAHELNKKLHNKES